MHSVCILISVSMYLYSYLATHSISGLAARGDWEQFEVRLKMTIEWTKRYTPRQWSSEFGDAIGDRDSVNSGMHWQAVIEWVWRCTLRPWLSIRNNSSFCQKHLGVPDGSDGSESTLYPLTENFTLPVAKATGSSLLDWCSGLQVHLGARWITVEQSGKNIFFGNAANAPGNHSYYISFNDFQNLCIQFVFSSIYLWICITTYLHTVYLDGQHAVIVSKSRCGWRWQLSELRDTLRGRDRASLEI